MNRTKLQRPNSAILPAKTEYETSNIRPITNSRSMTQIDTLKDGLKIDNMKPIKKWSYIKNSDKSASCLPDRTNNFNVNETLSDKVNFHANLTKSASLTHENSRPLVSKAVATKRNSIESLVNRFEAGSSANSKPITNSQSMTQIDSVKVRFKPDKTKSEKKWTYFDNFNNLPSCSSDVETNINMNESLPDKANFLQYQSKSASILKDNVDMKSTETKDNSIATLVNKFEEVACVKNDYLVPNTRRITNSRSMTEIDSLNDGFKLDKTQPVRKWSYLDSFNKTNSFLPDRVADINTNEILSDNASFTQHQSKSDPVVRENSRRFVVSNTATNQKSADSYNSNVEEDTDALQKKAKETVGVTSKRFVAENSPKITFLEEPFVDKRDDNSKDRSLKNSESVHCVTENKEETKIELCENNEKMWEDANFLGDIWKSYVERPLLPLKPLQKRSLSCTNLVQTIKGFSRKKAASNNRFSSPENTLFESKEICTSEANITNMPARKFSVESADKNLRSLNVEDESPTIKRERQSLQNYPWYHFVDAKEASKRLLDMHRNGAFLIRPASNPTTEVLHTLCVVCLGRVYNFHIRSLTNGHITLSKRKEQRQTFSSLLDMIKYHQTVPITINLAGEVVHVLLLITPSK